MSDSSLAMSRPVPTGRAVAVLAAGLLPAALAIANPRFGLSALGINRGVILLRAIDFFLAPHADDLRAERKMKLILSSGGQTRYHSGSSCSPAGRWWEKFATLRPAR